MGVQLPSEPITRKEQYLAKAAGQAVEVPAEPITREEAYLEAIANAGGGGGGTTNYNDLDNLPQIGGVTLQGNKTASDLGLADSDTVDGILDGTDIDSFGDVETALEGKQDALTAGDYIQFEGNEISVKRTLDVPLIRYEFVSGDYPKMYLKKYENEELISTNEYSFTGTAQNWNIDGFFTLYSERNSGWTPVWRIVLIKDSANPEHSAGYKTSWGVQSTYDFSYSFNLTDVSGYKLVIKSELDAALATKADLTDLAPAFSASTAYTVGQYVSYDGNIYKCTSAHSAGAWVAGDFTLVAVGSELESKQNATDNSLQTTDKTVVGAINEHEGDIGSLKSGLTNVDVALSVPDGTGKNLIPLTLSNLKKLNSRWDWNENSVTVSGVTFDISTDSNDKVIRITCNGTATTDIYMQLTSDIGNVGLKFLEIGKQYIISGGSQLLRVRAYHYNGTDNAVSTGNEVTFTMGTSNNGNIDLYTRSGDVLNNVSVIPMIRPATITDPTFAPYIPSVDARLEAVESGLATLISHGFVTYLEGFYCEDEHKAKYTIISNGTHGIAMVNGYLKNLNALTGGSPYSMCTVPITSARFSTGIVNDSIGNVYIEDNSDIIKFVSSSNMGQFQNIQFTLSFMF